MKKQFKGQMQQRKKTNPYSLHKSDRRRQQTGRYLSHIRLSTHMIQRLPHRNVPATYTCEILGHVLYRSTHLFMARLITISIWVEQWHRATMRPFLNLLLFVMNEKNLYWTLKGPKRIWHTDRLKSL